MMKRAERGDPLGREVAPAHDGADRQKADDVAEHDEGAGEEDAALEVALGIFQLVSHPGHRLDPAVGEDGEHHKAEEGDDVVESGIGRRRQRCLGEGLLQSHAAHREGEDATDQQQHVECHHGETADGRHFGEAGATQGDELGDGGNQRDGDHAQNKGAEVDTGAQGDRDDGDVAAKQHEGERHPHGERLAKHPDDVGSEPHGQTDKGESGRDRVAHPGKDTARLFAKAGTKLNHHQNERDEEKQTADHEHRNGGISHSVKTDPDISDAKREFR